MNNIALARQFANSGEDVISIKASLSAVITRKKPNLHVSYCPALDLYSQGETRQDAEKNIIEAARLFIESCLERNTLNDALTECGFHSVRHPAQKPKHAQRKLALNLTGNDWQIKIPAELPMMAY